VAQTLEIGTEYVLRVPNGYDKWPLIAGSASSEWCYLSRGNRDDVQSLCLNAGATYTPNTPATVELLSTVLERVSSVKVVLGDGRSGWVARELVDMTQEQRKEYEADQLARAKRLANAKALQAKQATLARAKDAAKQAKEQAFVATLPKLQGGSNEVLVATSTDCARDYKSVVDLGRRNGTGVEYRKKILELISLGCAVDLPTGTAIIVSHRDQELVNFCAYNGPKKGTCGVALIESVH